MKISLEWLNEYLDRPVDRDEAERLLTEQGFPIEESDEASDGVVDVEVTSNRSDCLSHVGVAREIVAGSDRRMAWPDDRAATAGTESVEQAARVDNEATDLCPLYTARVIHGVKVGSSPAWMARRLEAVGLRSVNNVVDVTNYVLLETGQPLHAFDMVRLAGRRIVVRRAARGESFVAIDGSKHMLDEQVLVIADDAQPVAVAGVMGGVESEVGPDTADVLLESAIFDPLAVRRASRKLKLASDSSYRFERGVDPLGVEVASRRAAALICQVAGGRLAPGVISVGGDAPSSRAVTMRVDRCRALLGLDLDGDRMVDLLERLGLNPRLAGGRIACSIPSFRLDLDREVDLVEEVARLHGLDQIQVNERIRIVARPVTPNVAARQCLGRVLTAHGFHETITSTFLLPRYGDPFVPDGARAVRVDESRSGGGGSVLRPSLLPSLLVCRKSNQDAGNTHLNLYEVASTWSRRDADIAERQVLAMISDVSSDSDVADQRQKMMRRMRGTLEELASNLVGRNAIAFAAAPVKNLESSARIELHGRQVGVAGIADAALQNMFGIHGPVAVAELDLAALIEKYPPLPQVVRLPRFPAVERDLSIVVQDAVRWDDIKRLVQPVDTPLLEDLVFLTIYRGMPVPPGYKSVSFRMIFRSADTTLRHEQVDKQIGEVVDRLKRELNAELREGG